MKVKKGSKWLRRDFEQQLEKELSGNVVVDLNTLPDFVGRDLYIANLLSCQAVEEAIDADILAQEKINRKALKAAAKRERERNRLEEEEEALKRKLGV